MAELIILLLGVLGSAVMVVIKWCNPDIYIWTATLIPLIISVFIVLAMNEMFTWFD